MDLRIFVAAILLFSVAGCSGADATGDEADVKAGHALRIEATSALSLSEVSGLVRSVHGGILAVGDSEPAVVAFDLDAKARADNETRFDLSKLPVSGEDGSQWEAVATDGTGRVFVMSENPSGVYAFDPAIGKLLHTITLEVLPGSEAFASWSKNLNSRGEGMVLLRGGHILVAIEKDPPALAEFGPADSQAGGYEPGAAIGSATFPLPKTASSKMVLLHTWSIKSGDRASLKDISELAVGPDERLYLMSQESRDIVRVERALGADEFMVDVKSVHSLPSEIRAPEGLVILDDRRVVVADDTHDGDDNLFVLSALPAVTE